MDVLFLASPPEAGAEGAYLGQLGSRDFRRAWDLFVRLRSKSGALSGVGLEETSKATKAKSGRSLNPKPLNP